MKPLLATAFLMLTSCETARVGVSYQGQYANYSAVRTFANGQRSWDVLIDANGKDVVPLHR